MTAQNPIRDDRQGQRDAAGHPAAVLDEPALPGHPEPGQRAREPDQRQQHVAGPDHGAERAHSADGQAHEARGNDRPEHVEASHHPVRGHEAAPEPRPDLKAAGDHGHRREHDVRHQ